ncbi:MAG TPA: Crp/Fnr family transcriptional regulator [Desulfitobacterium dehalogenans]|uniref:Crp/Fnr family transcriptional regulator n=1 Tax=Desulfitobacterium dehalogenans TaxID=36854 RepID=A0A7C6Z3D5_9FIRM|nr:Crp/Fnr family transcriptional regulator [Desulfitobacterium dehalogenans]
MAGNILKFEIFKNNPNWQGLPDSFWEYCSDHGRVRHYAAKQFLFFSGEDGNSVYFLLKGRIQILLMSEFTEKIFRILQPPAFFPEVILDNKVYPYAALTAEASDVFVLDRKALLQYFNENPSALLPFYRNMALDLRRAYRQIKNIALGDARSRLGAKIFALAHVHGQETPEGILITIPLTATELAGMCSLARESVSRILSELKDLGILKMEKKQITVNNLDQLRGWIHERQNSL